MSDLGHLGPYELRGELGRGAMARVWRAWDPNLEREVAIKEPLFDPRLSEEVLEEMGRRFVKEGKTAARLQHPGIVTIYAADVYDGRPAIVMELVDGATLSDLLERGPLGPESSLDALDQLLDAAAYAHGKGVIHRDIKPDNIFVDQEGHIKLADFGIAHVDDASTTKATVVGSVLGTPGYMSPEQATGAPVDARSDLFSIGVVGYEMLSGHNPFGAGDGTDSTTLLYRIVHEPAPTLPDASTAGLPADLRPAIMAALEKNPDDRPQTAADFKAMLHGGAVPTKTSVHTSLSGGSSFGKASTPKWLPYAIAGVACVVALTVLFGVFSLGGGGGGGSAPLNEAVTAGNSPVYLAAKDGKVAIYTNSSSEPYEITNVLIDDLPRDTQSAIGDRMGFGTVEEAEAEVQTLQGIVEKKVKVAAIVNATPYKVGVSFIDLNDESYNFSINGSRPQLSASMVKLGIVLYAFNQIDQGRLSLSTPYTLRSSDIVGGTGALQNRPVGTTVTVEDLINLMISQSDNTAANIMMNMLGMDKINAYMRELNLDVSLNRKMMDFEAQGRGIDNYMSADAVSRILEMIYQKSEASPALMDIARSALINQIDDVGIVDGVPSGTVVAHKTGTLGQARNDGAIVYGDHPYVLTVMVESSQGLSDAEALAIIERISRTVYDSMY